MDNYTTYILYSGQINKFYIGSTSMSVSDRLQRHNTNHKGYTGQTNDWLVVFSKEFSNVSDSRRLESRIKKRGAKRFIEDHR